MSRALPLCCAVLLLCGAWTATAQEIDDLFEDPTAGIIDEQGRPVGDEPGSGGAADGDSSGDSIDDLFGDPSVGIVDTDDWDTAPGAAAPGASSTTPAAAGAVDIAALTTAPLRISGSVESSLGAGVGLVEWPGTDAADGRTVRELTDVFAAYSLATTIAFDARPRPYLRYYMSLSTSLVPSAMTFSTPGVGELFIDYTFADRIFVRAGKQGLTWGQARFLDNPTNLVGRLGGGVSIRATTPLGLGTGTAIIYGLSGWMQGDPYPASDPRSFGYAAQIENTRGRYSFIVAGHAHVTEQIQTSASVTAGLNRFDLTAEAVGRFKHSGDFYRGPADNSYDGLLQVVWEPGNPVWTIVGEYRFTSTIDDWMGHRVGLGVQAPTRPGRFGWKPRIRWLHAFHDHSGQIAAGFEGTVAPDMKLTVGVPVFYGEPNSYYRAAGAEGVPGGNVTGLFAVVNLDFSF